MKTSVETWRHGVKITNDQKHMGNTADTNELDATGEAKLKTLNMERKSVKIKKET